MPDQPTPPVPPTPTATPPDATPDINTPPPAPAPQPPAPPAFTPPPAPPASSEETILAKELGLSVTAIDSQKTTGAGKDPMEVPTPAPQTKTQSLDSVHAVREGGKGYRVEFEGEYYARASQDAGAKAKIHKHYTAVVNLSDLETALKVIKDGLGIIVVRKQHPEALKLRTYNITKATPRSTETPESRNIRFMPHDALVAYVKGHLREVTDPKTKTVTAQHILDLDNPHYKHTDTLREAIMDFVYNPRNFDKREARRLAVRSEMLDLAEMNPEIAKELGRT